MSSLSLPYSLTRAHSWACRAATWLSRAATLSGKVPSHFAPNTATSRQFVRAM